MFLIPRLLAFVPKPTTVISVLAIVLSLCASTTLSAQTFTDGFESPTLNPYWTIEPGNPGTATLTTSTAKSGAQSVLLENSPIYPWSVLLTHDYPSLDYGTVSVFMQSGTVCCGSAAAIEITGANRTTLAYFSRNPDSSYSVGWYPPGQNPSITPISPPLTGWHKFEISAMPNGITMKLDGAVVFSNPLAVKFQTVALETWGGPGGSQYFDDFRASMGTCQLSVSPSVLNGVLTLPFSLQTPTPQTWSTYAVLNGAVAKLWSIPIPAITTSYQAAFPIGQLGNIGILTVLSTAQDGVSCGDWKIVNTGGLGASPEQLRQTVLEKGLMKNLP